MRLNRLDTLGIYIYHIIPVHTEWRKSLSLQATGDLNFTDIILAFIDHTLTGFRP
jgi:hypothetical protein